MAKPTHMTTKTSIQTAAYAAINIAVARWRRHGKLFSPTCRTAAALTGTIMAPTVTTDIRSVVDGSG
jgi:hypothetical protein